MRADELDHIRADVRTAMVEAQYEDHALLPDLLDHLLTALGKAATGQKDSPGYACSMTEAWAEQLLRECQIRAVSQIPFHDRELDDNDAHWSEHL